jgi:hypothetical protein
LVSHNKEEHSWREFEKKVGKMVGSLKEEGRIDEFA